jgi:predicted phage-related endonuclease
MAISSAMSKEAKANEEMLNPTKHIEMLCGKRVALANKIKDLEAEKKAYEDAIKVAMKAPHKDTFGKYYISWITTTTNRIDTTKVKELFPDVAEACTVTSEWDRLTITVNG